MVASLPQNSPIENDLELDSYGMESNRTASLDAQQDAIHNNRR
jgi:hypothetical protein